MYILVYNYVCVCVCVRVYVIIIWYELPDACVTLHVRKH